MKGFVFIVDIDGTIADDRERLAKAGPPPPRYDKPTYAAWLAALQPEEALAGDRPIKAVRTILAALARMQRMGATLKPEIVYLTSRDERYFEITSKWLSKHRFPLGGLIMRPTGEWAASSALKEKLLRELQEKWQRELVAIDNDGNNDMTEVYARLGIVHLKVVLP